MMNWIVMKLELYQHTMFLMPALLQKVIFVSLLTVVVFFLLVSSVSFRFIVCF